MAVVEPGVELGGDEPGLGDAVAGALPGEGEIADGGRIEEDDRLGGNAAVLGAAEGEDVDAGPPGQVRR